MESSSNIQSTNNNRRQKLNLQVFGILLIASLIASFAEIPYATELLKLPSLSLQELVVGILLQTLINIPIILIGLYLGAKVGLGARDLRALVAREPKALENFLKSARDAIIIGLIAGGVILIFSSLWNLILPLYIAKNIKLPSGIAGFLGSISAGINEEIILRLFVMSLLVWLLTKIVRKPQPNDGIIWMANIIAALLFGAGHLPLAAEIYKGLTPVIVFYIIFLNSIGGTLFGWLYWKRGILAAMIAHFGADIILHVLPAFFVK